MEHCNPGRNLVGCSQDEKFAVEEFFFVEEKNGKIVIEVVFVFVVLHGIPVWLKSPKKCGQIVVTGHTEVTYIAAAEAKIRKYITAQHRQCGVVFCAGEDRHTIAIAAYDVGDMAEISAKLHGRCIAAGGNDCVVVPKYRCCGDEVPGTARYKCVGHPLHHGSVLVRKFDECMVAGQKAAQQIMKSHERYVSGHNQAHSSGADVVIESITGDEQHEAFCCQVSGPDGVERGFQS